MASRLRGRGKGGALTSWLMMFAGGDVHSCDKKDADLIAYVAAKDGTWGIQTGHLVIADAQRPWKCDGEFQGCVLYFRML